MKLWFRLMTGIVVFSQLPGAAFAQWNAANDESNRQSMMADMRASAAANDRANNASQQRFNDNAARSLGSNTSGGGGSSSSSAGGGGGSFLGSNVGAYRGAGPHSIVKSYTFTMHQQESPASLAARLQSEAGAGNALSAYNLGRVYFTGFDGLARDDAKAREWFGTGATLGHPGAQSQYGQMLYNGVGGPADKTAAMVWLEKAADQGDSYGQALYGFWTLSSQVKADGDVRNPEAVAMLVSAADAGQLVAQGYLGFTVYGLGFGAPADYTRAAHYARLAADQGFAPAQADLGGYYLYGNGVPKDYSQAILWLRKAVAQNHAGAKLTLGRMMLTGTGMPENRGAGAQMVKQAADAGNMAAVGFYGLLLQMGVGVTKDEAAGAVMLERAAQSHDSSSEQNYAITLFKGQGVAKNETTGVYWQKRAADDGDGDAAATYCVRATTGQGMPANAVQGVKYGQMAAKAGIARGQSCLGYAYHDGNGVTKDLRTSADWFKKAAAQGDHDAADALKGPEFASIRQ
jgi:TPR repeat protein